MSGEAAGAVIPFVDLHGQVQELGPEFEAAWKACLDRCDFILGQDVEAFEREYSVFLGAKHVIGVSSGLEALILALEAIGVGRETDCVVPANTFIATALAASRLGARIVWCDIDPATRNMDAGTLAAALELTRGRTVVIPVHLCGRAVEPEVFALCESRGIQVIEDACQSHGARFPDGPMTGLRGKAGAFSFYPGKNLGAFGDGGAIATNDGDLAERIRLARNYGQKVKYDHQVLGVNSRLDTVQAAVLRVKLKRLGDWNRARGAVAARYDRLLAESAPWIGRPPLAQPGCHVWHLYTITCRDRGHRDGLLARLKEKNVQAGIHYPVPCHRQVCYRGIDCAVPDLRHTEREADRTLSLPMFPEITGEQQRRVVEAVASIRD